MSWVTDIFHGPMKERGVKMLVEVMQKLLFAGTS